VPSSEKKRWNVHVEGSKTFNSKANHREPLSNIGENESSKGLDSTLGIPCMTMDRRGEEGLSITGK